MTTEPCWRCNGSGWDRDNHPDGGTCCPECDGKKVMPKLWIEWWDHMPDGDVKHRIEPRDAIKRQKASSIYVMGLQVYRNNWHALEDFILVHWANKVYES